MEFGLSTNSNDGASVVYFHSSEKMDECEAKSAKLVMGPSVFLGNGVPWHPAYEKLYQTVYNRNLPRIVRDDGVFIVVQTNQYSEGKFICRYKHILDLLLGGRAPKWELMDEKVWERKSADHFQVPFSHVLIFRPSGGSAKRRDLKGNQWFQGVWKHKQTKGSDKAGYPEGLCNMFVEACTEKGDLIVDPFSGSSQLLASAQRLGRRGIGYEIDEAMRPLIEAKGVKFVE